MMLDSMSECRPYPANPRIRLYTDGRIETCMRRGGKKPTDTWLPVALCRDRDGYLRFTYRLDGKTHTKTLHGAMLETFRGPRPPGLEVRHYPDQDKDNCRLENLRWGTDLENTDDKYLHGTMIYGQRNGMAKLSDAERAAARHEHAAFGISIRQLAERYGMSYRGMQHVIKGRPSARGKRLRPRSLGPAPALATA